MARNLCWSCSKRLSEEDDFNDSVYFCRSLPLYKGRALTAIHALEGLGKNSFARHTGTRKVSQYTAINNGTIYNFISTSTLRVTALYIIRAVFVYLRGCVSRSQGVCAELCFHSLHSLQQKQNSKIHSQRLTEKHA